jgi:hypothetical protein
MTLNSQLIALFQLSGRLVEMRWLGKFRKSLLTRDPDNIVEGITAAEVSGLDCYLVINQIADDVCSRRKMPIDKLYSPMRGQCTADSDIARVILLPFDFDPVRATATAASLDQVALAVQMRDVLVAYLTERGWGNPAGDVFSGNGHHCYYADNLENTPELRLLLYNLYHGLARKFDSPAIKFDKSVRSPAQLMRFPGTVNHKAQRRCEILSVNEAPTLIAVEDIQAVVKELRVEQGRVKPLTARKGGWSVESMESLLNLYGWDYCAPVPWSGGLMWILSPCPYNPQHDRTSPAVFLTKEGWPRFRCLHNSCTEYKWKDFRKQLYQLTGKWFASPEEKP